MELKISSFTAQIMQGFDDALKKYAAGEEELPRGAVITWSQLSENDRQVRVGFNIEFLGEGDVYDETETN